MDQDEKTSEAILLYKPILGVKLRDKVRVVSLIANVRLIDFVRQLSYLLWRSRMIK